MNENDVQPSNDPLDTLEKAADLFYLLSNLNRLNIFVLLLKEGEMTVSQIAARINLETAQISQSLRFFNMRRLTDVRKEKKFHKYSVSAKISESMRVILLDLLQEIHNTASSSDTNSVHSSSDIADGIPPPSRTEQLP